ncbi:SH3 domain-containing protein [uncultured Lutibacter sp.]|uniref:SH3 domain-containing protein n=1 Tax=uncultured Lutibacter sp. TaxID=437739 RepID=UPI00261A2A6E|nr:SH3 domain-containing protein [uncultured Lutibacter sp.]
MKNVITILFLTLILTSCTSEVSFSELVERDNTYYKVNSDKPYTGSVVDYHNKENKTKSVEGKLKDGKFDSKWVAYYSNGQIKEIWNYNVGIKNGKYIKYKDNGQIIKEEEYSNGEKNGIWSTYFNNGTKDKVIEYKGGYMNGVYIEYFSSGYLGMSEEEGFKEKGYYSMSSKDGEWRKRNEYGTEILRQNYNDGILNGLSSQLLNFGNWVGFTWKGNYLNGLKNGEWTLLNKSKSVVQTHLYENDENVTLVGIWKATNLSTKKSYYVKFDKTNFYYSANKPYRWGNEDLHYRDSYKYYKYRSWYPYKGNINPRPNTYEIRGYHRILINAHLHDIVEFSLNSFTIEGGYGNMKYKYERIGKIPSTSNKIIKKDNSKTYYTINVDNLRVRTSPNLDSDKIENLSIGSEVEFIEKSSNQTTVTIKNNELTEYWYKVKTPSGNIGWIHGCCFDK